MGLDIFHEKATLQRPNETEPYLYNERVIIEEGFKDFNVGFHHFDKYIQSVEYAISKFSIYIVKSELEIPALKDVAIGDYHILVCPTENMIDKEISIIEQKEKLTYLHKLSFGLYSWKGIDYYEFELKNGFYVEEVGYQRKGMNEKFYTKFCSSDVYNYALEEDFEYAYNCVDRHWQSDTKEIVRERKKIFKEDFIDKFELGSSYLSVSY